MGEWASYAPSDFLLFSDRVYWRLFVLENRALWPLPVLAPVVLIAGAALWRVRPPAGAVAIGAVLALCWASVGWHFVWGRYAEINWAVAWLAPAFALQGVLSAWAAAAVPQAAGRSARLAGQGLLVAGAVLWPVLAPLSGRPLAGAEVAGIAPDPTAVAGLGLAFLVAQGWRRAILAAVPVLWLVQSAAVLAVLDGPAAAPPLIVLAVALAAALAGLRRAR